MKPRETPSIFLSYSSLEKLCTYFLRPSYIYPAKIEYLSLLNHLTKNGLIYDILELSVLKMSLEHYCDQWTRNLTIRAKTYRLPQNHQTMTLFIELKEAHKSQLHVLLSPEAITAFSDFSFYWMSSIWKTKSDYWSDQYNSVSAKENHTHSVLNMPTNWKGYPLTNQVVQPLVL